MKRYRRILSSHEKARILQQGKIQPSFTDWVVYPPGTVVFLFDLEASRPEHLSKIPQLHFENYGETWILDFTSALATIPDASQNGWPGAVVFRGAIPLDQMSDISWVRYEPPA